MPWTAEFVEPEVFLTLEDDRDIYHSYKDGNADDVLSHWYTTSGGVCEDEFEFDVRALPGYDTEKDDDKNEHRKEVIRAAVVSGDITFPEDNS